MGVDHSAVIAFGVPVKVASMHEAEAFEEAHIDERFPDLSFYEYGSAAYSGPLYVVLGAGRQTTSRFDRVERVDEKNVAGQIQRLLIAHPEMTTTGELGWYFGMRVW